MVFGKNNIGIAAIIILIITLSQLKFFIFLTETPLGRIMLLTLIVLISYTNKILGLLGVLFIIIAFNQHNAKIYSIEGFDTSGNSIQDNSNIPKAKEIVQKENVQKETSKKFGGREGFCMTDRESYILKGKPSNSIKVFNNTREQEDNISPSDKSVFSGDFAPV
jgi:hypothetical protein